MVMTAFHIDSQTTPVIYSYITDVQTYPKLSFQQALEKEIEDWCGGVLG